MLVFKRLDYSNLIRLGIIMFIVYKVRDNTY